MADLSVESIGVLLNQLARFFTQILAFPFMGTTFITLALSFLVLYVIIRAFVPKG